MLTNLEKRFRQKGVTINMLWQHYLQTCPDGFGHTRFHKYFTAFTRRARPVMHLEHKAGDKMYIDYAGEKLSITDKDTGEIQLLEVFFAIFGCSQQTYVEAVRTQRREDFIGAWENALHYYGGVPAAIVPDILKSAVTKRSKYEPTLNETFADFAEHYGTAIVSARAFRTSLETPRHNN